MEIIDEYIEEIKNKLKSGKTITSIILDHQNSDSQTFKLAVAIVVNGNDKLLTEVQNINREKTTC